MGVKLGTDLVRPAPGQMDVWLAIGDSMTDGRGDIAEAPVGYPPASKLFMVKNAATGYEVLAEPCGAASLASAGVGPWGMFGWLVSQQTGRDTCIINGGIGGVTTSTWVPGQPSYQTALGKLQRAMARTNALFRGFVVYIGPNDAASGATPPWLSNVQACLAGYRTWAGKTAAQSPAIISRLTAGVPVDSGPTTGWAHVQSQISAIADANHLLITPPSPANREAYTPGLHHKTGQNYTIAQSALALAMGHASWS